MTMSPYRSNNSLLRKWRKFRQQPVRFFDDSRSPIVRGVGFWYLAFVRSLRESGRQIGQPSADYRLATAKQQLEANLSQGKPRLLNLNNYGEGLQSSTGVPKASLPDETRFPTPTIDESIKLVSLDVWDTLLHRDCHPDEIKLQSARYLYLTRYKYIRPEYQDVIELFRKRINYENVASRTNDCEYRYEDAIPLWLAAVFCKECPNEILESSKSSLLDHEFVAELKATVPNKKAKTFLRKLDGAEVTFASDFYMPGEFIGRLLLAHGFDDRLCNGYSSSDYVKNKRSGTLFKQIAKEKSLKPQQILHIGDNVNADVNVPERLGLRAIHYVDKNQQARQWRFRTAFEGRLRGDLQEHENRIRSTLESIALSKNSQKEEETVADLYKLGVRLSPLATGFILFVIEQALHHEVDDIYFFTREGRFFEELYKLVTRLDPYSVQYPTSKLLAVSRIATFAGSLKDVSLTECMRLWSQYSAQSPKAFCRSLNLDDNAVKPVFEAHGLAFEARIEVPWKHPDFVRVFEDAQFQRYSESRRAKQNAVLTKYLAEQGLNDSADPAMIVDIGWRGTIQDNIFRVLERNVHGCYLGLFQFLNSQQRNNSKSGWLLDWNNGDGMWASDEVAPIELIFGTLGGSVLGYVERDGNIEPLKEIVPEEEMVIKKYGMPLQQGIMAGTQWLAKYIGRHGLSSSELRPLARRIFASLLEAPPSSLADAFFETAHNETFGTGEVARPMPQFDLTKLKTAEHSAERHFHASGILNRVRWPSGFVRTSAILSQMRTLDQAKINQLPRPYKLALTARAPRNNPRIGIYVPPPVAASGGHRTIFNLARTLSEYGAKVQCFLEDKGEGVKVAREYLGQADVDLHIGWDAGARLDMAFATIAQSAQYVAGLPHTPIKGYLIQDFEACFNPMSDGYLVAENSYSVGLNNFTIGNWLTHVLRVRYGQNACPAGLGVDTEVYRPLRALKKEREVCFLYQPDKPRRTPRLGIDALRLVKQQMPDVKIYVYGSDLPLSLDFEVENLGLIHDLERLNELYNHCAVGLCVSTSNPSRIPFEMMAAGTIPVDVYRYNNLFDYRDGTLILAHQTSSSLAEAMIQLLQDEKELLARSASCLSFATPRSLRWEMDVICNNVMTLLETGELPLSAVEPTYNECPVISRADASGYALEFCNWQRELANMGRADQSATRKSRSSGRRGRRRQKPHQ